MPKLSLIWPGNNNPVQGLALKFFVAIVLLALAGPSVALTGEVGSSRVFTFEYVTRIDRDATLSGPLQVFIPLAVENEQQQVQAETVEAAVQGNIEVEPGYGNRYWHTTVNADQLPLEVRVISTVKRIGSRVGQPLSSRELTAAEQKQFADYLGPNQRVVVDHPILQPILDEIRMEPGADPALVARSIYDWVVDNVEYKKVGTGWGNGDTFWACNERYGNCTDFHSLFISLARTQGIPARFEMGFPVPDAKGGKSGGKIGGYHCWVQFYLPDIGWVPIDASEAFKHPGKREFFFGSHPLDRIHFSTGRDLQLGSHHRSDSLNYFVYPHVEAGGKVVKAGVHSEFSFTEAPVPGSVPGLVVANDVANDGANETAPTTGPGSQAASQ